ncbi:sensor histidine kinase [Tellurirhabdus rosea]|uniref:sensor histidine kinase n=1 Tax=Tellurirhabdus rosea TaxID=2674997 RepID=UPI00225A834E|nr:ATP-binding protein [Tellurirhabdus rosea]
MNTLVDFFSKLFDTSDWPPRWYCGNWTDFHGWLYLFSDLTIWAAYMAIPLVLIRFIIVKKGVPLIRVFWLFGAFILLCGFTHLLDATMFYWPAYRFNAVIRFLTGVVSIATVIALIRYFDEAVGLRTSQEYNMELRIRQQVEQELRRSNEELQQFAYVASHDLQSPLKTIENYLKLFEAKYGEGLDENGHRIIDTTTAAAGRMRGLINDLLDFSRVGNSIEFETFQLDELVSEICDELQNDIAQTEATIDVPALPQLTAHRIDMKRLFQNLITNALKYHKPGVAPEVKLSFRDEAGLYLFSISDNGIGIEKTYFDRIFLIFQRLHGRGEYPGTGIGLATCKKIVEIYGGKIWVESTVGEGSTFYFTLPKMINPLRYYAQENQLHSVG